MSWNSRDDVSRADQRCLLENCWIADGRRGGCDSPIWGTGCVVPEDDPRRERGASRRARNRKKGEFMSFKDLVLYLRARYAGEEGQTMAEYGVVLAVIAIGVVVALTALSGGISGAIDRVVGYL
jgi:Flp pilus assembly pilin Flp